MELRTSMRAATAIITVIQFQAWIASSEYFVWWMLKRMDGELRCWRFIYLNCTIMASSSGSSVEAATSLGGYEGSQRYSMCNSINSII